jgi:hypothetical protein
VVHHDRRGGARGVVETHGRGDPVVNREGEQTPDLVSEDERMTILGEGDEPNRPHPLPPSTREQRTRRRSLSTQYALPSRVCGKPRRNLPAKPKCRAYSRSST